jgi:hypothetical protein
MTQRFEVLILIAAAIAQRYHVMNVGCCRD